MNISLANIIAAIGLLLIVLVIMWSQRKESKPRIRCRTIIRSEDDMSIIGDGAVIDWSRPIKRKRQREAEPRGA